MGAGAGAVGREAAAAGGSAPSAAEELGTRLLDGPEMPMLRLRKDIFELEQRWDRVVLFQRHAGLDSALRKMLIPKKHQWKIMPAPG